MEIYADKNGGVVRMLGLELGSGEAAGPKCQRYAAIVENGVLLKLVRFWRVSAVAGWGLTAGLGGGVGCRHGKREQAGRRGRACVSPSA